MNFFANNTVTDAGELRHPDIVDREVERIINELKRKWCPAAEQQLTDFMRKQGVIFPILLFDRAGLASGSLRLAVAKRLGFKTVPCIHIVFLTIEQVRGFNEVAKQEERGRIVFPDSIRDFDCRRSQSIQ